MKKCFYVFMSILICVSMLTSCQNGNKASGNTTEPSTTPSLTTDQPPITTEQPPITTDPTPTMPTEEQLSLFLIYNVPSSTISFFESCGLTIQESYHVNELKDIDDPIILNRLLMGASEYLEVVNAIEVIAKAYNYYNLPGSYYVLTNRLAEPFDYNLTETESGWFDDCYNNKYHTNTFSYPPSEKEKLTQEESDLIKKWGDYCIYWETIKWEFWEDRLPMKYTFIRDFEVSKEDFIIINNLNTEPEETLSDYEIEVLYSGDTDRIMRELSFEDAFFSDGKLYKTRDIDEEVFEKLINDPDFIPFLERAAITHSKINKLINGYDKLIKYYIQYNNITSI